MVRRGAQHAEGVTDAVFGLLLTPAECYRSRRSLDIRGMSVNTDERGLRSGDLREEGEMRKSMLVVATALASAMLTSAGEFSPADARMTLNQCRSNETGCHNSCLLSLNGMEYNSSTLYGLKQCLNRCDGNHAACVDFVFNQLAGAIIGGGPSKPPKRPAEAARPGGGLLQSDPGFSPQGPARTGTPGRPGGGAGTLY